MRLTFVALLAAAVACTPGGADPRAGASRATPASSPAAVAPSSRPATPVAPTVGTGTGAAPATAPPTAAPAVTSPSTAGSAFPRDTRCGTPKYRCVTLDQALTWWDGKPALMPRSGTAGIRAMLHAPSDPDVRRSDDADNPPGHTYVLPDSLFPAMTARRGGVSGAARSGGIVVRTYFVTERWLPAMDDHVSRRVTVRGRDAILSEFRTSDTRSLLRDVKWWVPHGDGTYVLWLVEDDGAHRSEKDLIDTLNGLAEA